ncbi:MAG: hypothetical protein HYS12_30040 [Planctomycetes bacterium]|nr:hypothetical protein [Planctomycetota bacterium]
MAVYIVCEGSLQGLDSRVLQVLVIQSHNLGALIAPGGGDRGLGAIRAYLERRSPHDVAISVEDRNYRPRGVAQPTWANLAGRSFIWRRHEIENYLLQPRVVLELFNDFRARLPLPWVAQLPATEMDVSALLQSLASSLLEDHAAGVLRDELVRHINGIGSVSFGPPRPAPAPGAHTLGQAQWLPALQQEASRLCQTCGSIAALPDLQAAAIAVRYGILLVGFQVPAFLTSGDYLIDIGGHELLAALARHLHNLGASGALNQSALANELLRVLARIYQPSTIYQPDDFAELGAILAQY